MILTKYAPSTLKRSSIYQQLNRKRRQWLLRKQLNNANPLRVILGAGPILFEGWFQTDKELLDVTSPEDWSTLFKPDSIDSVLSEHMLEHLSENEGRIAVARVLSLSQAGRTFSRRGPGW